MDVILVAITLQVLAGTAALVLSKWPRAATVAGAGGTLLGCLLALAPTLRGKNSCLTSLQCAHAYADPGLGFSAHLVA